MIKRLSDTTLVDWANEDIEEQATYGVPLKNRKGLEKTLAGATALTVSSLEKGV